MEISGATGTVQLRLIISMFLRQLPDGPSYTVSIAVL
jgi:hypothetical protein